MKRAIILVMDSFGIGAAGDADDFGDVGADTFGHIWHACAKGEADKAGLRAGPLKIPNLLKLGLGVAGAESAGSTCPDMELTGAYGYAVELSSGKDTPSGHWEMAGLPVTFDWGVFPNTVPCFPQGFIDAWVKRCDLLGVLGNKHASGTTVIEELGDAHIHTGKPICYTSADSVFQIAAHEESFGLDRLYEICIIAKEMLEPLNIGRVIARPFLGNSPDTYTRTDNRRDYTTLPHEDTLLNVLEDAGGEVVSIGKISDIFAHSGITKKIKTSGNMNLFDATLTEMDIAGDNSLIFTNFVDFDMHYGHRRDVIGYANALEEFDKRLPELMAKLDPNDLVLITADHGCDPTWPGSDHTREHVPVIFFGQNIKTQNLGKRNSFADMGQTIAGHLGLPALNYGEDCFK